MAVVRVGLLCVRGRLHGRGIIAVGQPSFAGPQLLRRMLDFIKGGLGGYV